MESVEGLCDELRRRAATGGSCDLWVPDALTIGGAPVPDDPTGMATALILDTALSLDLWPQGFTEGEGGRTYHYTRA
jgi:hypothetical protein